MSEINYPNYPLIELCIDKVERIKNMVFTDYKKLSESIKQELDEDISEAEILDYYENYYCCEQYDMKLQAKNLGINYQ